MSELPRYAEALKDTEIARLKQRIADLESQLAATATPVSAEKEPESRIGNFGDSWHEEMARQIAALPVPAYPIKGLSVSEPVDHRTDKQAAENSDIAKQVYRELNSDTPRRRQCRYFEQCDQPDCTFPNCVPRK